MAKKTIQVKPKTARKPIDESVFLVCPRCAVTMKKLKKHDVILDICPSCRGMWVDAGEVSKLAKHKRDVL